MAVRGWWLAALLLAACAGEELARVGSPCADFSQCEARATAACIASWPEGYCTEIDCQPNSCAAGARCAQGLTFPGVDITNFCLATCQIRTDCRAGYTCVDIGQAEDVCVPDNPT